MTRNRVQMNRKWTVLILALWTIVLILILTFYTIPQENSQEAALIAETLEKEKAVLQQKNKDLDAQIDQLKIQANQLTVRLAKREHTIKKLEHALQKKINTITAMSAMDLHRYFTEFKTDSTRHQP